MAAVPLEVLKATFRVGANGFPYNEIPKFLPLDVEGLERGLPRGAATEIVGEAYSGRTSLLYAVLTRATRLGEVTALVDAADTFDPVSATEAGINLKQLLWVRCAGNALHALKATDLLAHAGGFGVVAFDLGDIPAAVARRISLTSWFRLRRAVEHTPTVLIVIGRERQLRQCASLVVEAQIAEEDPRRFQYVRLHHR